MPTAPAADPRMPMPRSDFRLPRPVLRAFAHGLLVLLLVALAGNAFAGKGAKKRDLLNRNQYAYSAAIRWGDFEGASSMVDPKVRKDHPLTDVDFSRYAQIQVTAYRDLATMPGPDDTVLMVEAVDESRHVPSHIQRTTLFLSAMRHFAALLRTGIDANTIRPMDVAGRISPRPLLVIHCMEDKVVPPDNSDRNFAAAREPKQFWRVPSGGHIAAFKVARDEYERRVTRFFEDNLLSKN